MRKISLIFVVPLFVCHFASADTKYTGLVTCWTEPTKSYYFNFSGSFSSGKAGTTQSFNFGNTYAYPAVCSDMPSDTYTYESYGKAFMDPAYPQTDHVLHISSGLDAVVNLDPASGSSMYWIRPPFTDAALNDIRVGPSTSSMLYGQRGRVDMTLTADAIGGAVVIPPHVMLWSYFISNTAGNYNSMPLTVGYTAGQVIPVAVTCSINNGQAINVDFGDLESSSLKSTGPASTIKKDVTLNYSCSSSLTQDIEITLVGNTASFESTALNSSIADVGVVMMQNGTPIKPYGYFNSKLVNGVGSDTVTFAPIIRSGATNVQGNFTASATLVMTSA